MNVKNTVSGGGPGVPTLKISLQDGRFIPFLVLGFWDKNTGLCAGAMPYISPGFSGHYQDLGISSLKGMNLSAIVFLAWTPHRKLSSEAAVASETCKLGVYPSRNPDAKRFRVSDIRVSRYFPPLTRLADSCECQSTPSTLS